MFKKKTLNFWEEEDLFSPFLSSCKRRRLHTRHLPARASEKNRERERERERKKEETGRATTLPKGGVAKSEKIIVVPLFFCFQDDESGRVFETRDDDDFNGFLQQRVEKAFF